VVYLLADFRIWTLLRWPVTRFLFIALGGIVPFLSFYTEARYAKLAEQQLKELEK
jgi:integral membrane protein